MVEVPCRDNDGNHWPTMGTLFFIVMSTVTNPVDSSIVVAEETCERSAMAVAASDGLSDVIAERTALRAMSLSRKVSRHTDKVASSSTAHTTTNGVIRANSTVAWPLLLLLGTRRTAEDVIEDSVKQRTNFPGSSAGSCPSNDEQGNNGCYEKNQGIFSSGLATRTFRCLAEHIYLSLVGE